MPTDEQDELSVRGGDWADRPDGLTHTIDAMHPVKAAPEAKAQAWARWNRAMELVGNRHSKFALVALVNYLLAEAEKGKSDG